MATIADIFAEARDLVDATIGSMPNALLLRRVNQAGGEIIAKFIASNKNIRFDDLNNNDLPIGTFDLTNGKQDYAYNGTLLSIERIELLGVDGLYHRTTKIDEKLIPGSLAEYKKTPGLPDEYARRANSLFFYCPPSSSSVVCGADTNGGKIYFQRAFVPFTMDEVTAGTKEPGFASPYHYILSYKAALPYAASYKKDRVAWIMSEIQRMETEMLGLVSMADNDKLSRIMPARHSNK